MRKISLVVLAILGAFILQGCTTKSSQSVPSNGIMSKDDVTFPDAEKSIYKKALGVNLENIRKIESGMSKDEIRKLIGVPHFPAGVARVVEWDYLFNLKKRAGDKDFICQYKVVFDSDDHKARSLFWKDESCENFVNEKEGYELDSFVLFDFASAKLEKSEKVKISNLVDEFGKNNIKSIVVIGHTDLIGDDDLNTILSLRRAKSVKDELVRLGIERDIITIKGLGKSDPTKECDSKLVRNKFIKCLKPNRRAQIEIKIY